MPIRRRGHRARTRVDTCLLLASESRGRGKENGGGRLIYRVVRDKWSEPDGGRSMTAGKEKGDLGEKSTERRDQMVPSTNTQLGLQRWVVSQKQANRLAQLKLAE